MVILLLLGLLLLRLREGVLERDIMRRHGWFHEAAGGRYSILRGGGEGEGDGEGWNVHSRVLGNVLYLMGSQRTTGEEVRGVVGRVRGALGMAC